MLKWRLRLASATTTQSLCASLEQTQLEVRFLPVGAALSTLPAGANRSCGQSKPAADSIEVCHVDCEKTTANVVQREGWAGASDKDTSPVKTWKTVVGKLFHVR